MNKKYALSKLYDFGDAIVNLKDGRSFLATTDFSNKHIRKVRRKRINDLKGKIIVFNWTDYKYEDVLSHNITFITPLSKILNNEPREV